MKYFYALVLLATELQRNSTTLEFINSPIDDILLYWILS